ncbi:hypothetical protein [Saccharopolyspora mangrovi]|uniref:Uncharacterized protein n=1 Tax=Saccharopolyspora mangrovi TaxID=3082379 RepID=A0ABU6ALP4_9PSEU|nr:hypothetical protein [Saccharopolyspora sp. S2-29]MEB3372438.1 hypothetical protein [Saccharopolyspora sp. S2-29]
MRDFAGRVRNSRMPRSFFQADERSLGLCPLFIDSIRRGYRQRGGTIQADPALVADVVLRLAFTPTPKPSLLDRLRTLLRRSR